MRMVWSLVVAVALSSCGLLTVRDTSHLDEPKACLPARLKVDRRRVEAGMSVTVSSGPFACGARYRPGKVYALELLSVGRAAPIALGVVPVHTDGSFSATVQVPADASPGESYLAAHGTRFDQPCDDTGSCAGYGVGLTVVGNGP